MAVKHSRFSEQQIAFILQQAEAGTVVEEVCRKAGISIQTYYRWRKKYGGLMPSEMKRLPARGGEREGEEAGGRPLARQGDAAGRRQTKDIKPARARQLVDDLRTAYRTSIRRACDALCFDRSTYHYRHRRPEQVDADA